MLKEFLQRARQRKVKFKDAKEDMAVSRILNERQKNSNERELEGYLEEERQKKIKIQLEHFRKMRKEEAMKTTVLNGKNIFKNQDNILKQPNIFAHNRSMFLGQQGMFIK